LRGYLRLLEDWSQGKNLPARFVRQYISRSGVVGDTIVGRISVRHELNEFLATVGGHVGYVVVPSERKKGYGTSGIVFSQAIYCRAWSCLRLLM
jgi:predicted acetyltransferase